VVWRLGASQAVRNYALETITGTVLTQFTVCFEELKAWKVSLPSTLIKLLNFCLKKSLNS